MKQKLKNLACAIMILVAVVATCALENRDTTTPLLLQLALLAAWYAITAILSRKWLRIDAKYNDL